MLVNVLGRKLKQSIILVASNNKSYKTIVRYKGVICLNVLPINRIFGRSWGVIKLIAVIRILINRTNGEKHQIIVRNDPLYLLAAILLRNYNIEVIYQSSFPHEFSPVSIQKRLVARMILFSLRNKVNKSLTVSELGYTRLQRNGFHSDNLVIPLSISVKEIGEKNVIVDPITLPMKFVYIGSHSIHREIWLLFEAFAKLLKDGFNVSLYTFGCSDIEYYELNRNGFIENMNDAAIYIGGVLSRAEVLSKIREMHVGVSLVPPIYIYKESTPTKISEYLGCGLPILVNRGIHFHEEVINNSSAGILVEYNIRSIANSLAWFYNNKDKLPQMSVAANQYVSKHLNYEYYGKKLLKHLTLM